MSDTYTQCRLQRDTTQKTAWIPSCYAQRGKVIEISGRGPAQIEAKTWKVVSCGSVLDAQYVEEHERDYRTQRQASDI